MSRTMVALIGGALLGILGTLAADRLSSSGNQPADAIVRDIVDVPVMVQAVAEKHRVEQYVNLTSVEDVIALPTEFARSAAFYALAGRSDSAAVQNLIFEADRIADDVERHDVLNIPSAALRYADLFRIASAGERYKSIIDRNIAIENPHAAIERVLASGSGLRSSNEFHGAVTALASTDLDAVRRYFEQARSSEARQLFGSAIVSEMAKNDPSAALSWARSNDMGRFSYFLMTALGQIAQTDPQLALMEALNTPNTQVRSSIISNVLHHIARSNPADAVAYLDQIDDRQQKLELSQQLASSWIRHDPDAAIDWILSHDDETAGLTQVVLTGP